MTGSRIAHFLFWTLVWLCGLGTIAGVVVLQVGAWVVKDRIAAEKGNQETSPHVGNYDKPPPPRKQEGVQQARILPALPPHDLPITRNYLTDLLSYRTGSGAIRRQRVYPIKCVGGLVDGFTFLLLDSPETLVEYGMQCAWVPKLSLHRRLTIQQVPIKKKEPASVASYVPDEHIMEIDEISLCVMEEHTKGHQLTFLGSIDFKSYGDLFKELKPVIRQKDDPSKVDHHQERLLAVKTESGTTRKIVYYPVRCTGGPLEGKIVPILSHPAKMFNSGLGAVCLFIPATAPKPDATLKLPAGSQLGKVRNTFVVAALYVIEQTEPDYYCLRFMGTVCAEDYVSKQQSALNSRSGSNEKKGRE